MKYSETEQFTANQEKLAKEDAGNIDDAGADDTEYFEPGYITEE